MNHATHATREPNDSRRLWRRELCLTAVLGIGMLMGLLFYLMLGATSWPPLEILQVLAGNQAGSTAYDVVWHLRLPRGLLACMIGAGFAVSGFILQIALRNPLADPGVVGVTGGASLAVVSVILLADVMPNWGVSAIPLSYLPAAAIIGGVGAMALVLALNWQHAANPAKLALYGVVLGALLNAAVMWVVIGWGGGRSEVTLMWLAGTLYGRDFQHVALLWPWLLLSFVSLLLMLRPLGLLRFEDHIAAALGLQVKFWRLLLVLIAVGLAASATAASGPMGFVGLVAPHWVRLFIKRYLWLQLIASALLGALLLLGADLLGRTLLVPLELPAGAMTTLIGIPLFLYLLFRHTGRGLHAKY